MSRFVGLDGSQKLTSICVIDETGRRLWRVNADRSRSRSSGRCEGMLEAMPALGSKPAR
jgi:hypothetical protein